MARRSLVQAGVVAAALSVGYLAGSVRAEAGAGLRAEAAPQAPLEDDRVFELRTYTAAEGKYDALLTRFRDHTMRIFEKHGMANVGYWTPQDAPLAGNTLVYVLAHESREAAERSWEAFVADPEWQAVAEASRRDGPLIVGLERVYLDPTDFSPLR
jgi:hypothetical protein